MHSLPPLARLLTDPRIAALIAAPAPAMLIDASGELRFANLAGLALLGAPTLTEAAAAGAPALGPFADATERLIARLRAGGPPERERIEMPDGQALRSWRFDCFRIALADGSEAVLFAATETGDQSPNLAASAASLLDGEREPLVLFSAEGNRLHANPAASALIGPARTFSEIIPGALGALASARSEGEAEVSFGVLRVLLRRLATGASPTVLAAFFGPERELAAGPGAATEATKSAQSTETVEPAAAPEPAPLEPQPSRAPARFVWQTDTEGRFTFVSPELAAVVGDESAAIKGLDWNEAAARIGIDKAAAVSAAISRRDTWSGVMVTWPVAASELVRPVDLAALPVFDRERRFLGYRGFGVFREPVPRQVPPVECEEAAGETAEEAVPTEKVLPQPLPSDDETPRAALTQGERNAFREIARVIGARLRRVETRPAPGARPATTIPALPPSPFASALDKTDAASGQPYSLVNGERAVLDRLPLGVVVHRGERVLYANRPVLDWMGLANLAELTAAGGLERLFAGAPGLKVDEAGETGRALTISGAGGEPIPVEARLMTVAWEGETALVYVLQRAGAGLDERLEAGELALREADATARELRAILDTATDGIALIGRNGRLLGINRSAEALFGYDSAEIEDKSFTVLFAPESHRAALDYLDGLAASGVASVLNDGREVIGQVREGGLIPLFMTIGRVGENGQKFCAVFRDITQWKRAEEELTHAKRQAERASSAKSEFLAKISHEIRTPLNAIIGFSEVMMEERFGPVGNERYRAYLKDIHASGEHLISLVNDLLDLSKIEAGKLDLKFTSVDLNDIASQCMAIMQPQANRERIIIRTALASELPPVVADARSIRQIVLNLLSNSIRFTPPGGQVIVSTALTDEGEVHLRVRDTGIGMSESEIKTALEPFRQLATTTRSGSGGTGLGLPLTKALTEANRATFSIRSTLNGGTLVEIAFPSTRVLAE
jgi:PAS domain S-box-containing protein